MKGRLIGFSITIVVVALLLTGCRVGLSRATPIPSSPTPTPSASPSLEAAARLSPEGEATPTEDETGEATPTPSLTPTETPTLTPTFTFTPTPELKGIVNAKPSLNLRSGPSMEKEILETLPTGSEVKVRGRNEAGDWLAVAAEQGDGWVYAEYLDLNAPLDSIPLSTGAPLTPASQPTETSALATPISTPTVIRLHSALAGPKAEVTVSELNVRGGPGVAYPIHGYLKEGDVVNVVGVDPVSGWLQIAYPGTSDGVAWISGHELYVQIEGSLSVVPEVAAPVPPPEVSAAVSETPPPGAAPTEGGLTGKLVFQTSSGGGIYIINADGTGLTYLTNGLDPAWSPDGNQVAFARWGWSSDGRGPGLYIIKADGSGEYLLLGVEWPKAPTWSSDGTRLAFTRQHGGHREPWERCRSFKGKRVCFEMPANPHWKLGRVRLEDGHLAELHCHDFSYSPTWSPDGETIIYASDKGLYRTGEKAGLEVVTEPNKGAVSQDVRDRSPDWSPDGTRIVFQYRSHDHYEIMVMNADGSGRQFLTKSPVLADQPVNSVSPAWSPDGQHIAYLTDNRGRWELFVMNADGSEQRPMFEGVLDDLEFEYHKVDERVVDWAPRTPAEK